MAERALKSESKDTVDTRFRAKSPNKPLEKSIVSNNINNFILQRKTDCACGGGCPNCQSKTVNLPVSQLSDASEIEADRVADKVMRMSGKEILSLKQSQTRNLSKSTSPIVQAKRESGSAKNNQLSGEIASSRGGSMDGGTKSFMEKRFGADFGSVKIHTDGAAVQMSRKLNAQAFSVGNDVFFNQGKYAPESESGKLLLAHELAHTLQQNGVIRRKISPEIDVENPQPVAENDAENTQPDTENDAETPEVQEEADEILMVNPDDPEIIRQFAEVNKGLSRTNLKLWIAKNLDNGWHLGDVVPDYRKPSVSFNDMDEPVIEAVQFGGKDGAFNTASKFLPKNVGAKFWWKRRFSETISSYELDYSSNTAYQNYLLHKTKLDVDFEALKTISGDLTDYREVMSVRAYNDKLLSEALVRLVARTQAQLYVGNIAKQTGILDGQTQADINLRISAEKTAIANRAAAQAAPPPTGDTANQAVILQGPIHDTLRERIAELETDIQSPPSTEMQIAAHYLGSMPALVPDIPVIFLYRISQHFALGFYKHLETIPEEEIVAKFSHLLMAPLTLSYQWGAIKGIPQGIWNWIKDIADLIWTLIKLPFLAIKYIVADLPGDIQSAYQSASQAMEWFNENQDVVLDFAKDLLTGDGSALNDIKSAVKEQVYQMAEGMGAGIASGLLSFAGKSNEEIGERMGEIEGYLLPDILLLIFSEGIGTAIKGAFQSIKLFMEAGTVTLKILEMGKSAYAAISKFLESSKMFAGNAYAEVKIMLRRILEYFKKLLGIEEKALEAARIEKEALETARAANSVWRLDKFERGRRIEQTILGRPANIPVSNFPVIDDFANGVATSIKSVDLTAESYQTASKLRSLLTGYASKLSGFAGRTWGGITVPGATITDRVLLVAIEDGVATQAQAAVMQEFVRNAATQYPNIRVIFRAIP